MSQFPYQTSAFWICTSDMIVRYLHIAAIAYSLLPKVKSNINKA